MGLHKPPDFDVGAELGFPREPDRTQTPKKKTMEVKKAPKREKEVTIHERQKKKQRRLTFSQNGHRQNGAPMLARPAKPPERRLTKTMETDKTTETACPRRVDRESEAVLPRRAREGRRTRG